MSKIKLKVKIGVPKEIKNHEYRVGLIPSSVAELVRVGHEVFVENNAGIGVGITDNLYIQAGAKMLDSPEAIFSAANLIIKVKEPLSQETALLNQDHVLFTFLHLAASRKLTEELIKSGCTAIAYETVTDNKQALPILAPMSEVAGRMSIQIGAHCLEKAQGGPGVLLGGVPGVPPAHVVILGGGVVGTQALRMAVGLGAKVTILDKSLARLRELDANYGSLIQTVYAVQESIEYYIQAADLLIGAVLVPGAKAPKLVTRQMLSQMKKGAVIVDVAIDQGGCCETSRPTTHAQPTYTEEGILHYCVTNIPGSVPRTSTFALNNATLPFILEMANKGIEQAFQDNPHLLNGLNISQGKIKHRSIAQIWDEFL